MCLKNIKNLFRKNQEEPRKFWDINSLEEFKETFLSLSKQELALADEKSYWPVQDTLFGEMFDNKIKLKFLLAEYKEYSENLDLEELKKQAEEEYKKDLENLENVSE